MGADSDVAHRVSWSAGVPVVITLRRKTVTIAGAITGNGTFVRRRWRIRDAARRRIDLRGWA